MTQDKELKSAHGLVWGHLKRGGCDPPMDKGLLGPRKGVLPGKAREMLGRRQDLNQDLMDEKAFRIWEVTVKCGSASRGNKGTEG